MHDLDASVTSRAEALRWKTNAANAVSRRYPWCSSLFDIDRGNSELPSH